MSSPTSRRRPSTSPTFVSSLDTALSPPEESPARTSRAMQSSLGAGLTPPAEPPRSQRARPPSASSAWNSQLSLRDFSGVQVAAAVTHRDVSDLPADRRPTPQTLPDAAGEPSRLKARHAAEGELRQRCFGESVCFGSAPYLGPHALSDEGARALQGEGAALIRPVEGAEAQVLVPAAVSASPFKTNRAQFPSPRRATTGTFAFGGADDEVSRELAPTLNQSPSRKGGLGSPAQAAAFGGSNMRALLTGGPGAAP